MAFTSQDLIDGVKRGVTIPANQNRVKDSDLLAFADDITKTYLVPQMMRANGEYFVSSTSIALVKDTQIYAIPTRSIARSIRDIAYRLPSGEMRPLIQLPPEHEFRFSASSGEPAFFDFEGDKLKVFPTPAATCGSLFVKFGFQPSDLALVSSVSTVQSVNFTTGVVVLSTPLSNATVGQTYDFIFGQPGHSTLGTDVSPTNVDGAFTTLTFNISDLPLTLAKGDYISPAGTTPVVQLPVEICPVLASGVRREAMRAIGDLNMYPVCAKEFAEALLSIPTLLNPRDAGGPKKIVRSGIHGIMRCAGRRGL